MWQGAAGVVIALVVGSGAAADVVACRPTALGTVSCPAGPPPPRPEAGPLPRGPQPVQGLDGVRARTKAAPGESFVPAGRTGGLGGVVLRQGGSATDCRRDTLGNLLCR